MRVTVIPNHTKDIGLVQTKALCDVLLAGGAQISMSEIYRTCGIDADYCVDGLYEGSSAAIVLGGDGTILQAAVPCARLGIPVMGINLGRIGFMTETEPKEVREAAERLLAGSYRIEERMMMSVRIRTKEAEQSYLSLNDCVVAKNDAQMIMTGVFADDEEITEYIADGVIISTPTGSTGYSLSAGGPVADPGTEVFLATPICAHSLLARPALLAAEKTICVRLLEGASQCAGVTIDGVVCGNISRGDEVIIEKSDARLRLIKFGRQSFYDVLTAKLG